MTTDPIYNVFCAACGAVWQPGSRSPLWWKAWKRDLAGKLDAYCATAIECGCERAPIRPDAPFRIVGHTDMCEDIDIPLDTFTGAVRKFRDLNRWCVVFICGVSKSVEQRLRFSGF